MEVCGQLHDPIALPPGKDPSGIHWTEDWVGLRAGLDLVAQKEIFLSPCRESNPGRPAHSLDTVAELFRPPLTMQTNSNSLKYLNDSGY